MTLLRQAGTLASACLLLACAAAPVVREEAGAPAAPVVEAPAPAMQPAPPSPKPHNTRCHSRPGAPKLRC